jgi:hypothetical protein
MDGPEMANNVIYATSVVEPVEIIPVARLILPTAEKRFCEPTRNGAVYAV